MRRITCAALLLAAVPAQAADEPKPNTLTPKEVADGWVLLFDGETTFGWRIDGEAKVENGALVLGGTKAAKAVTTTGFPNMACSFRLEARWEGKEAPSFDVPGMFGGRLLDSAKGKFVTQSVVHSQPPVVRRLPQPQPWTFDVPVGSKLLLRNLKVRLEVMKPLFNGKDLAGWKQYDAEPGRAKSKFTVTPEGWLNVKDGPGDLQTEGQYADFVLQFDCVSNGKHLNSGAFFRCLPGQYQQGYEAQVQNDFTVAGKEYAVEVYDPKTNELLKEKQTVKSDARDFGTGAIYRRVPARKGLAKDNEWFTMTVVADGRHIATWVNGVQVVDWTDNRTLKDNARNGCRLEKGGISLQGHDPTTDLSFRNLRLAELPPAK